MTRDHRAQGFTLIELLIVVAIIGIIAAIATPILLSARISSNEASAIASLRAVNSGQHAFSASCAGSTAYADTLPNLITGEYLSEDMGFNPKAGYNFVMGPGPGAVAGPLSCLGQPTHTGYVTTAQPVSMSTGSRAFGTSHEGTIWEKAGVVAPTVPFAADPAAKPIQ